MTNHTAPDTASWQWQINRFGRQHLERVSVPLPTPGPGQILVRVEAASLNYRDLMLTDDAYGWTPPLPFVPASDLAGQVQAVGPGVQRWQAGDAVISTFYAGWLDGVAGPGVHALGGPGPGALASHVLLHEDWAVAAPRTLDAAEASTLPVAALTAWFAMAELNRLKAGQTVLIHGTGGVALFGVQLARLQGAQVIVVSGDADKRERALALGATHVLARDADWWADARRLTGGRGVDQVLETVGGPNVARSLQALAGGGKLSLIGVLAGADIQVSAFQLIQQRLSIEAISVGHRRSLEDLIRAVDANALKPVIAERYDGRTQVPQAFEALERGPFGKVVLTFA